MTPLAHAQNLTRRYGQRLALDDVTLEVPPGQILGLLGPNGAGKTTLISTLVGLRRPTSGTVRVCGHDPRSEAARQQFGLTPQETSLPEAWKVHELVEFVAAHFPDPAAPAQIMEQFTLRALAGRQIGALSGGQQRRLAVALAFVGRPRLVFLDEPTTGLDVEARRDLWDGIRAFHAEGGSVLLTSHYLEEVEALAQRVVVIDRGRILTDGTLDEVRGLVRLKRVTLTGEVPERLDGVSDVRRDGARTELLTADPVRLIRDLVASDADVTDIEIHSASLEDAFLALTSRAEAA